VTFDQTKACPQCGWERTVRVDQGGIDQMIQNVMRAKDLAKRYLYQHMQKEHHGTVTG
jgi:Zn-finger nucleic acid-binding protein